MIPRYTLPEMGALWSDQARFSAMLEVEQAVLDALADHGIVPRDAADAIRQRGRVDPARIAELEAVTDHDVIAFVSQVAETVGDEGRWLHFGLTSSDVVDTALALQCRRAGNHLIAALDEDIAVLVRRAREHADTRMMGRTHSVHAEPITLGLKFAELGVRARPRSSSAPGSRRGHRHGQDLRSGRDVFGAGPGDRGGGPRPTGTRCRPREHADRAARPPCRVSGGDRHHRRIDRTVRHRDSQPPAH